MEEKRRTGIVIEIVSKKQCLGKVEQSGKFDKLWIDENSGQITYCVVLPKGRVFDNIVGLKFQIDGSKGDQKENIFFLPWERILEVRTLDGRPIYRNWYLCPKCRRIAKLFLKNYKGVMCRFCGVVIFPEENKKVCISNFEEIFPAEQKETPAIELHYSKDSGFTEEGT